MSLAKQQPATQSVRTAALALCLALAALLTGCQSLSSTSSLARLRVINLSSDSGTLDVYHGNDAVAYNLSYGTVTSYVPLATGTATITTDTAGSRQVLSSLKQVFNPGGRYTMLVTNFAATLQPIILNDQVPPQSEAKPSVRIIHQALHTGAVDVYLVPAGQRLSSVTPLVVNLAPGAVTGYLAVPSSVFRVVMMPTGVVPASQSATLHTGAQINYLAGSARSLILLDAPPSLEAGVQVITTIDNETTN